MHRSVPLRNESLGVYVCVNTLFFVNSRSTVASAMMFIRSSKARICRGLPGVATSLTFIG